MGSLGRCVAASAALAAVFLAQGASAMAANVNVTATFSSTFSPKHVAIGVGDTVTWTNQSGFHNVHFDDNSFIQPSPPSSAAWTVMRAFPAVGTFAYYCEVHGGPNGSGMSGTVAVNTGYPRPRGATPLRASLGVAYKPCVAPNRTHGPSLASPSCNPPVQLSDWLTVGTPDANGATANSVGSVALNVLAGDPGTTADESDVQIGASLTDVRNKAGLADYTGQLQARLPLRVTDRKSGPSNGEPATGDTTINVVVPCTATAATGVGSTCSVMTTVDAIAPGAVPEGRRSIWELDKVQVFDGGPDGVASTADNTLFASQGLFVP
jgi:plastocyanin